MDVPCWETWYRELAAQRRAATVTLPDGRPAWVAAERLPAVRAAFPDATPQPEIAVPDGVRREWTSAEARVALVRGLVEVCGPITADQLSARLSLPTHQVEAALEALEGEGVVLRGHFSESPESRVKSQEPEEEVRPALDSGPSSGSRLSTLDPRPSEWCHRRLLARIHRLTVQGLRKQIEPVGVEVFVRFLTRLHGVLPGERRSGTNGLFEVVSMLQGIDLPAVCWERDLLPARLETYRSEWLDELCLTGEVGWGRLFPPKRDPDRGRPMASLTRVAPLSLFLRQDVEWLTAFRTPDEQDRLSGPAQEVYELLRDRGAMFAADLLHATRMLPDHLDDALGELVSRGVLTADGFGGLRQLIAEKPASSSGRMRRRPGFVRIRTTAGGTGRWSLWRDTLGLAGVEALRLAPSPAQDGASGWGLRSAAKTPLRSDPGQPALRCDLGRPDGDAAEPPPAPPYQGGEKKGDDRDGETMRPEQAVEEWAWQLLRRWGVVFRDLLAREPGAPAWFELLQVYRRLEARGEIRGGRFIAGVAGEQFALGDTVGRLRKLRDDGPQGELVVLCAADPLNLVGILSDAPRIPATASNRLALLDGIAVAAWQSGELQFLHELPPETQATIASSVAQASSLVRAGGTLALR